MSGSDAAILAARLPPGRVSTRSDDLVAHSGDWSPFFLLDQRRGWNQDVPQAVVRPHTTEEVSLVLSWASESGTPVVPFGGGSGVCRAISPDARSIVIDLTALNHMGPVDEVSRLVTVGAGVTGPALTEHLLQGDWTLGHEPQSISISTVGGWVSTKACGQLSARYGGIEDLVAGFEAVLPDGSIARAKVSPRRVAGPDVAALMIGAEGTLGVVTEVTLRVAPLEQQRADRCLRFDHMADGVKACRLIAQSGLVPDVLRLYDSEDASIFLMSHPDEIPGPLLIMSFSGDRAEERAAEAARLSGGRQGNDGLVQHWWSHRNDAVGAFREIMAGEGLLGPNGVVDTFEVAGTWSGLRSLYHRLKEDLSREADLVGCHLSHVYPDGACLYFTLASATTDDDAARARLEAWWTVGLQACIDEGGSISHHHGIGRVKSSHLPAELEGWWQTLRAVKSALDPKGIMNPGALGL